MDFTVGIVSRNLATMSISSNSETIGIYTFFEETSVGWDTWGILSGTQCATCQDPVQST